MKKILLVLLVLSLILLSGCGSTSIVTKEECNKLIEEKVEQSRFSGMWCLGATFPPVFEKDVKETEFTIDVKSLQVGTAFCSREFENRYGYSSNNDGKTYSCDLTIVTYVNEGELNLNCRCWYT